VYNNDIKNLKIFTMKESKSNINKILFPIIGIVGVIVVLYYIVQSKALPPPPGLMSNSTSENGKSNMTYATKVIHAPKGDIKVEISDTEDKEELGLSNRESLDQNSGMLFVFSDPGSYQFWMKDMHFPVDVVWINADKKVVSMNTNMSPDTYPKTFSPVSDILSVLELNAGATSKFGIATGTILQF
jgi:uncharacterized membrane protein (UPF0127 family)